MKQPKIEWLPITDKEMTYQEALEYAKSIDARLPSTQELKEAYYNGLLEKEWFWSSAVPQDYPAFACYFDGAHGYVSSAHQSISYAVRCVKDSANEYSPILTWEDLDLIIFNDDFMELEDNIPPVLENETINDDLDEKQTVLDEYIKKIKEEKAKEIPKIDHTGHTIITNTANGEVFRVCKECCEEVYDC